MEQRCGNQGLWSPAVECEEGHHCVDEVGCTLEGGECTPGEFTCQSDDVLYCTNDGTWALYDECGAYEPPKACEDGRCVGCDPGTSFCRGQSVMLCGDDGRTEEVIDICELGTECRDGACVRVCGRQGGGGGKPTYQGCEYWAVDLENADVEGGDISPASADFAVVVSNTDDRNAANVEIYRLGDGGEELVASRDVPPRGLETFLLPADNGLVGSLLGYKAFRVSTTQPVIAYQFNPLNNTEEAYSNDASLLLPTNALDTQYIITTGDSVRVDPFGPEDWGSYVVVVGVTDEPTSVTVEASTDILPQVQGGAGVQVNGRVVRATLERYQVLSVVAKLPDFLMTPQPGQGNLSGTRVVADHPVAVFSGNVAVSMPYTRVECCADHLEEQAFPISSWGRSFVAGRSLVRMQRGQPEADYWRITAAENGTEVTYLPGPPDASAPTRMSMGQSVEFPSTGHFLVQSNKPILLTHFLTSSQFAGNHTAHECREGVVGDATCTDLLGALAVCYVQEDPFMGDVSGCAPISDPAMTLIPPVEQFREDYLFLTPEDYAIDFVNILARTGTSVTLDDEALPMDDFRPVGELAGESWSVLTREVTDGVHHITAQRPVGVIVYGYDKDVSYGYPGGLNLERINPTE